MKVPLPCSSIRGGDGNDAVGPRATAAGDMCQGEVGYKEYGPTGVVPGLGCGCKCSVYTSNHLVCLMGSVLVWEAAVKSPGLLRNWWLIQEVSVLCKAMGDPLALGLSARGDAKPRCWVFVDMGSCYSLRLWWAQSPDHVPACVTQF